MDKNNSFPVFLNIVLSLVLLGSLAFSYFFGNFGGIGLKELNNNYILKDDLKFKDIPTVIKDEYVRKDAITLKPKSHKGLEKVFDKDGNPIQEVDGSVEDLQGLIKSLQERVVYLEQENMLLSNDKNELLKIVQTQKSDQKQEESNLVTKNLEKINEAEKQHYKNISELTMKINDLQRDNIALTQTINTNKENYEQSIASLKQQIEDAKNKATITSNQALKEQIKKYEDLMSLNKTYETKIEDLGTLLKSQNDETIMQNAKYQKQIQGLQNKINALIVEKNTLLTQHSQSIMDLEKQSSQKLSKIEQSVKNYQDEKKNIQSKYESLIAQNEKKFNKNLQALQKENSDLKEQVQKLNQNNVMILEKSENNLNAKEDEYKKLLQSAQDKFNKDVTSLNEKNSILTKNLEIKESTVKSLQIQLQNQKNKSQKDTDTILQLNDKISSLTQKSKNIDDEITKQVQENEEKHNKNYKFLNKQIADLELHLKNLKSEQQVTEQKNKSEYVNKLKEEQNKYKLVQKQLENIQQDKKELADKFSAIESKYTSLVAQNNTLTSNESQKILTLRKSFEELQKTVAQKEKEYAKNLQNLKNKIEEYEPLVAQSKEDKKTIAQYEEKLNTLQKTLKTVEGQIVSSNTVPISDKKRKLALLGQVECNDMNFGNFKISSTCKQKVNTFLAQFDASNYFEVIPIVGKGGFSSLNKLRDNKSANIDENEIDRLTELANLGLGKHRAKEGGWLIREKFGESAKISYTVYNIEADNKRGFVIKVYR